MIAAKAGSQVETADIKAMAENLLETRSLADLRENIQALNQKSQGGSNRGQESVAWLASFLYLGDQFVQVKKYSQAILLHLDGKTVLNTLENIILEHACSDEFEEKTNDCHAVCQLMRSFEYRLMAYYDIHHRIVDPKAQNPEDGEEVKQAPKDPYEVQDDFVKVVQMKIGMILTKQKTQYLISKGFVRNHAATKALVEFLHAYLNLLAKFPSKIDMKLNQIGIEFVSECIQDPRSQRDVLTQSSIIFWNLVKISKIGNSYEPFDLLISCLKTDDPTSLFLDEKSAANVEIPITRGIIQSAKLRGWVLTMDKEVNLEKALYIEVPGLKASSDAASMSDFILANCEKNEGLQKLYSFQALESIVTRLQGVSSDSWLQRLSGLVIKNFEYPLHSVSNSCEDIMKKLLSICNKQQVSVVLGHLQTLNSRQEIKSKFIALGIAIEYIDVQDYLKQNPKAVEEMILYSSETQMMGKYVLAFFEVLLKKLWSITGGRQDAWHQYWIEPYLSALRSDDDILRTAVSNYITPIIIKINKMSLAFIMSNFLEEHKKIPNNSIGSLASLLTLIKVARSQKLIRICDDTKDLRLEQPAQDILSQYQDEDSEVFSILQSDLLKLVLTQNWRMSLECFQIVTQECKNTPTEKGDGGKQETSVVTQFEYDMCFTFTQNCVRTTFPEHRQNFMKAIRQFMMRLRTLLTRDIKKFVSTGQMSAAVKNLIEFLRKTIGYCENTLYLDKPIETALPLFEILKIIQDLFGDFDHAVRITQVLPALGLLSKDGLMESDELLIFLLASLKSSWVLVRVNAYELLKHFPPSHPKLADKQFVNDVIWKTALEYCDNPKAMIAEGAGLLLKLLFAKCLGALDVIKPSNSVREMQLQFCRLILTMISDRLKVFQTTLIKEGKTTALLHGPLAFFKHLFADFKINQNELSPEQFQNWRKFFKDLIAEVLEISKVCAALLSNNRLQEGEDSELTVDCRGHPINQGPGQEEGAHGDYNNLILVGVWLALKENGSTLYNLLRWLELPKDDQDDAKFLQDEDITGLSQSLLTMLFDFKHRGAIDKAAESFSLLSNKLLCSSQAKHQKIPHEMLKQALNRIVTENHSAILRRSAGIPPTIIAILRSEPLSYQPVLLNETLEFLINLAKNSAEQDDSKIHALNIMRFIFQDSLLKHDLGKFITPAMILATENFKSENWSIRNSALMCFTSLTKRLLNTTNVQDQDLSRKKGLSIWEFVQRHEELSNFFKSKLKECLDHKGQDKVSRERSDMVIFSILLFMSRLIPAFQLTDSKNVTQTEDDAEESKAEVNTSLIKSREQSMREYVGLIKAYAKSGTYFVRKISAQALLPIMRFEEYTVEIKACFDQLLAKIQKPNECKLRQNEAHGLMIRINNFVQAYFRYREIDYSISGRSTAEEKELRAKEEQQLIKCFTDFQDDLQNAKKSLSLVLVALFLKTFRQMLKHSVQAEKDLVIKMEKFYHSELDQVLKTYLASPSTPIKPAEQVYLKDVTKMNIYLQVHPLVQNPKNITKILETILSNDEFLSGNIDYAFKFLKGYYSKIKLVLKVPEASMFDDMEAFLSKTFVPQILQKNDEHYCKVLEYSLKIVYRLRKHQQKQSTVDISKVLKELIQKYEINSHLQCLYIKLTALMTDCSKKDQVAWVGEILKQYAYGDQKENVRVAAVKSVSKVLTKLDLNLPVACYKDLLQAMMLILTDEHPEIRAYLVQCQGAEKLVNPEIYSLQSGSLVNNNTMVVDLNEQVLTTAILDLSVSHAKSDEDCKAVLNDFLVSNFLIFSAYREHYEKNFEDKIFFYEPINKYFDLLEHRRLCLDRMIQLNRFDLVDQVPIKKTMSELSKKIQKAQLYPGLYLAAQAMEEITKYQFLQNVLDLCSGKTLKESQLEQKMNDMKEIIDQMQKEMHQYKQKEVLQAKFKMSSTTQFKII